MKKLVREKLCYANEVTYLTVINGLCKAGQTSAALDLLNLWENWSCKPDVYAYTAIIDGLCKDRMVDDALHIFSSLSEKGILPDVVTYNSLIQGLCSLSIWKVVVELLNEMKARDVYPNLLTFNIVVNNCCKEGRVEDVEHILKIMKERNIQPDMITYNSLMDGYCLRGETNKAKQVLDVVLSSGLKPNIESYSTLMNGYSRKGQLDEVLQLFNEIPAKGLEHDVVSYSTMLHALFHQGKYDDGLKLFGEMKTSLISPDLTTYTIVLHGLCKAHRIVEALPFLDVMENGSVIPDIVTYNILIDGLCTTNKLDKGRDLFNELESKGVQPNVVTYNTLIGALCREGQVEEAKVLLTRMVQVEEAKVLLTRMVADGCLPDNVTYDVLVQGLARINKIDEAISFLEEMERRGFILDATTFEMLLEHLEKEGIDDCYTTDERNIHIPQCESTLKPNVGQTFYKLEDGIQFYKKYAATCGFDIRNGTITRAKDGTILSRYLLCNREGIRNVDRDEHDRKRRRMSSRTNCRARVIFSMNGADGYRVKVFVEAHNHELMCNEYKRFMKLNRNIDIGHQNFILNCSMVNIGPARSYRLFRELVGNYDDVGCNLGDFKNFSRDLRAYVVGVDAQIMLDKLHKQRDVCPGFTFDFCVDLSEKLTRLFWADEKAISNYNSFGDVVSFDATYCTNKYNMIFAPFTGKDNHEKCVTFATALLTSEDVESYYWVINKFVECMRSHPRILITDQDPAIKIAVERVIPHSIHRLCMWYIMCKVADKIPKSLKDIPDFTQKFNVIVWS